MKRLNIVIVNDFGYINGGAGKVALSSATALAKRGCDVTILSAVPPVAEELESDHLKIICTGQREILKDPNRLRAALQGIWNFRAAGEMERLLRNFSPSDTIVHLHGWTKALSSSVNRVAVKRGFKIVCTLHDYFAACPNGGFFDYPANSACSLIPMSSACLRKNCDSRSYAQKMWRFGRQLVQNKLGVLPRGIEHFIAVSEFSRRIIGPFLPEGATIHTIVNPIDMPKEDPVGVKHNRLFLAVGRLSPEKGPHLIARAADRVGVETIFVGEGGYREEVLRISPKARVTGWLDRAGVIRHLRAGRALVLGSLCYETMGMAVEEAASLGIPAIVPDTSAARDLVRDGETGLLFRGGDWEDLADKMHLLIDDGLAESMGREAYDRYWSSPLTMERHLSALEDLYRSVLRGNRSGSPDVRRANGGRVGRGSEGSRR